MSDDVPLVQRCLAGDAGAIREFVGRFQGGVFAVCLQMLRHWQDAEDVSQESLVRAVRHLRHWDMVRPLAPWIMTIAMNRCRTHLSKGRRQARPNLLAEDLPAVSERVDRVDLGEELDQAVAGLRDNYRECFLLFHQQELSLQEVAEILECPVGTVKTWLHRARKELAERLRERGIVNEVGHELR